MFVKEISYTDYNGNQKSKKYYFNLTKSELTEMDLTTVGGMRSFIDRITNSQDQAELIKLFKELILKAYGVKSDDGEKFMKGGDITTSFEQSMAYDAYFMELATNEKAAIEFVNGIMPRDLVEAANRENGKAALLAKIPQKIEESQRKD